MTHAAQHEHVILFDRHARPATCAQLAPAQVAVDICR
jgi:hypothetical protein